MRSLILLSIVIAEYIWPPSAIAEAIPIIPIAPVQIHVNNWSVKIKGSHLIKDEHNEIADIAIAMIDSQLALRYFIYFIFNCKNNELGWLREIGTLILYLKIHKIMKRKNKKQKFQTVRIRLDKRMLTEKDVIRIIQRELIDPKDEIDRIVVESVRQFELEYP